MRLHECRIGKERSGKKVKVLPKELNSFFEGKYVFAPLI